MVTHNIAINHRASGTGLKTATRFFAGYGGRYGDKVMKSKLTLFKHLLLCATLLCSTKIFATENDFFSIIIGDKSQPTYVEAIEEVRKEKYSVFAISFNNIREWKSVGSSMFSHCSIRELVISRGANWYATSSFEEGGISKYLVVLLNNINENPSEIYQQSQQKYNDVEPTFSDILSVSGPEHIKNGYKIQSMLCANIAKSSNKAKNKNAP